MWSNKEENLRNCWSNGEKLITFTTGNVKGSYHCYIENFLYNVWFKKYTCIGEIIAFYKTLNDQETSYIQECLMKKWGITDTIVSY